MDWKQEITQTFKAYVHPEKFTMFTENFIKAIVILLIMGISIRVLTMLVDKFFNNRSKFKIVGEEKRFNTIKGIINGVLKYTVYFVGFTPILKMFGVDISSLIAAAGVGGLAIGFGAQNLVRDVITGFFILLENQFHVGDHIEIGDKSGIVEDMTLRITTLKDFNGDLHIIPNGKIDQVTNKSKGDMRALVDVSIAYEENIDHAIEVLTKLCEEIKVDHEKIIEGPSVLGVTNLGESDIVISIVARTIPTQQWAVEREVRKKVKERLEAEGIEIPYPKRVVLKP